MSEIRFVGNQNFSDLDLSDIIFQKQNMKGLRHVILDYYYDGFRRNPNTPRELLRNTDDILMDLKYELRFFNKQTSDNDTLAIEEFYNVNGYHDASVYYTFVPDSNERKNILTYFITEGTRYTIRSFPLYFENDLPPDILQEAQSRFNIKKGDHYKESRIVDALNNVNAYLQNQGYFYSKYRFSNVYKDSATHTDSLAVAVFPGKRQRIGHINIIDSAGGQKLVVSEMKQKLMVLKEGDWYSLKKKSETEQNFFALGIFSLVIIDTTSEFYPINDSTLNLKIILNYIKLRNWSISPFIDQTQKDEYWNAGIDASIMFKNIFGAAQMMRFFGSIQLKDLSSLISSSDHPTNLEGQLGINFSQPILWTMDNARVGGTGSFIYSLRSLDNDFILQTISLPISFPVKLTNETYFDRISIDFLLERQNPTNFLDIQNRPLDSTATTDQKERYLQAIALYRVLYDYLTVDERHWLTSNLISLTLTGDSRNNPISPSSGEFTSLTLDGWNFFLAHPNISGIARFARFNFVYSSFFSMGRNFVNAFKAHFGWTYQFDAENSYVPFDRQFFAGGANSVRGWQARQLHYSNITEDSLGGQENFRLISNIIGSGAILEGSYELRFRFSRPPGWDKVWAEQVANIGFTWFVDVGQAFNWYAESEADRTDVSFFEAFTKLAWATGLGLRYETPIGPIRVDFALPFYRPYPGGIPSFKLWDATNALSNYQLHIGIGNAF